MANELRGMAASLRTMTADLESLKEQLLKAKVPSTLEEVSSDSNGDFSILIPEAKISGSYPIAQKVSSLLVVVKNLKPEEKKPRASVTVKFVAHVDDHSVVIASQVITKDGPSVLQVPACGLNSTVEIELDGTVDSVMVWGL